MNYYIFLIEEDSSKKKALSCGYIKKENFKGNPKQAFDWLSVLPTMPESKKDNPVYELFYNKENKVYYFKEKGE